MSHRNRKARAKVPRDNASSNQAEATAPAASGGPDEGDRAKNDKPAKASWDWMTIFTAILAFFAAVSLVALVIQLRDARKSFATDQRPYIWMATETKEYPSLFATAVTNPAGTKQISATMRYTNFGKSPAILVRSYHGLILGPSAGNIRPLPWVAAKQVVPPNKVDLFSAVSATATDQEIALYQAAEEGKGITVYATWQYTDTAGNRYETEILA